MTPFLRGQRAEHILSGRLASIEQRIVHFELENQIAGGKSPSIVDPRHEIEIQDVFFLGCAYVDRALAHNFVRIAGDGERIAGDGERPEALRKLGLLNSDFERLYSAYRIFEQSYADLTQPKPLISYPSRTPFVRNFYSLVNAIVGLPTW